MKAWVQNNMFAGAVAKVEGKRMEFATEDEAAEYAEEHEVLEHEMEEVKYGRNLYI